MHTRKFSLPLFIILGALFAFPHLSFASTDFAISAVNSDIATSTPSRAITLTVANGSVASSTASFALSDGGMGGVFYPASPLTIAANAAVGSSTQFVYIAPATATSTVTIHAVATGGISATHTLTLYVATSTKFAYDTFAGTAATNLTAHTPNVGATWVKGYTGGTLNKLLNGSGGAYDSGTGHVTTSYLVPTAPSTNEHDAMVTVANYNGSTTIAAISTFIPNSTTLSGYRFYIYQNSYQFVKYVNSSPTVFFQNYGSVTASSTHTLQIAVRNINGLQYVFPMSDGAIVNTPVQDSSLTSGYAGQIAEISSGQTPASTDSVYSYFTGLNTNWTLPVATAYTLAGPSVASANQMSANFTVTPNGVYNGTITPSDGVAGGTFTPSSLTFASTSTPQTFTYTPAVAGTQTISVASSPSLTNPPALSLITAPVSSFFLTSSSTSIGTSTPSRAISIEITNGSVGNTASFTLSDGGVGGVFYPSNPTIAAGSASSTITQFVYIAPAAATGTVNIQVVASGGTVGTSTIPMTIGSATKFAYDTFAGTAATNLTAHTPNVGATWVKGWTSGSLNKLLNGSGGTYQTGTGHVSTAYLIPTAPNTSEHDVVATISNLNSSTTIPGVIAFAPNSNTLTGYRLEEYQGAYTLIKYVNGAATTLLNNVGTAIASSTHTLRLAVRNINGSQYVIALADGALLGSVQDSTLASGYAGQLDEIPAGFTPTSTDSVTSNFSGFNTDWGAATSYTFTGPSVASVGQVSSNFTVTPNASYTGTITPSDGGADGTFTPASLTFTNSSASQTFTYTATSTGTTTISVSSSPGLTNPSPVTLNVAVTPVVVTFPNANVYESPYIWESSGTSLISPTGGAYLKFNVTGTQNISVNADTSINTALDSNDMPSIKVLINSAMASGTPYFVQFPFNDATSTLVSLASGLSTTTTYSVTLYMIGGNGTLGNGWTGTSFQTKINSLQLDSGSTLASPALANNTCIFWGDSILQTYYGTTTPIYYNQVDYSLAWPSYVAPVLGCEYSQIGIGSQGWVYNGANGGYPRFGSSWNYYDSTHPKTFSVAPNYAIIDMGTNDHGQSSTTLATNVLSTLTSMRSAFGTTTKIILITPYNPAFSDASQPARTGLISAYGTYEATTTPDANAFLIDLGTSTQAYTLSPNSLDNVHPNRAAHALIAGVINPDIQNILINTYTLTYAAGANGTLTGSTTQAVSSGASGTAVTAVPNSGYHFVNWSDASTTNPRTDTNVTGNINVTANFAINTYTLTYAAGANGTLTGSTTQAVSSGASGTAVTAVPNSGYHFVNWSDASTTNPRTDTNVTGNINVTANFAINTYTLTYAAGGSSTFVMGSHGWITWYGLLWQSNGLEGQTA